jgi:hypothetical protein
MDSWKNKQIEKKLYLTQNYNEMAHHLVKIETDERSQANEQRDRTKSSKI